MVEELGSETHVLFPIDARAGRRRRGARGDGRRRSARVLLAKDRRTLFTAEVSESSEARAGLDA